MQLTRQDLMTLETYAEQRAEWRLRMRGVRRQRTVHIGDHFTLLFENHETIHYQVQEMLHVERIFESAGIDDELGAYNPLIPDGDNLKATLQIEYADVDERRKMLETLINVEHGGLWMEVNGERCTAFADEDLERSDDTKTSAVHFLRYQLSPAAVAALKSGADLTVGVEHPAYPHSVVVPEATRALLVQDLA